MDNFDMLLKEQVDILRDKIIKEYGENNSEIIDLCKDMFNIFYSEGYGDGYNSGGSDVAIETVYKVMGEEFGFGEKRLGRLGEGITREMEGV